MADLLAIGYPDETTALAAMDEVGRLERDLIIQPDAVAAIVRNREGKLRGHHQPPRGGGGGDLGDVLGMLKPGTSALFLVVEKRDRPQVVAVQRRRGPAPGRPAWRGDERLSDVS